MKSRFVIVILLALASLAGVKASAKNDKRAIQQRVATMTAEQKATRAAEIKVRVEEIQAMDKSGLSVEERKALRHELRSMNTEAKALGSGGVYISLAGVLLIILVLIIIL